MLARNDRIAVHEDDRARFKRGIDGEDAHDFQGRIVSGE
jgi:hypothetical protein